jgi:hypothetical protein
MMAASGPPPKLLREKSTSPTQLEGGWCRWTSMNHFVLDLTLGISLELVRDEDGILSARWLWCDIPIGSVAVRVV